MSSTLKRLLELASTRFKVPVDQLNPTDDIFEKLGVNSLEALSLLSDLEIEFSLEVPDYELQGVTTFQELADVIERRRIS